MEATLPLPTVRATPVVAPRQESTLDRAMPLLFLGSYVFASVFLIVTGLSLV